MGSPPASRSMTPPGVSCAVLVMPAARKGAGVAQYRVPVPVRHQCRTIGHRGVERLAMRRGAGEVAESPATAHDPLRVRMASSIGGDAPLDLADIAGIHEVNLVEV